MNNSIKIIIKRNNQGLYYALLEDKIICENQIWYTDIREIVDSIVKTLNILGYKVEVELIR